MNREFTTRFGYKVTFDEDSTVQFYDKDNNIILQLDPSDLSVIYGAYQIMLKENI